MIWDVLIWLLVFGGNMVVGAVFWVLVDDEEQSFFHWYASAPLPFLIQPLMLTLWPVAFVLWLIAKYWLIVERK